MNSLEVTSVLKDSQHNFFLRIKGMIPALVVVIVAAVPPAVPCWQPVVRVWAICLPTRPRRLLTVA